MQRPRANITRYSSFSADATRDIAPTCEYYNSPAANAPLTSGNRPHTARDPDTSRAARNPIEQRHDSHCAHEYTPRSAHPRRSIKLPTSCNQRHIPTAICALSSQISRSSNSSGRGGFGLSMIASDMERMFVQYGRHRTERQDATRSNHRRAVSVTMNAMDERQRQAASFGAAAEAYERGRPEYPPAALDWLLPAGARDVLDLGAGTGKLTRQLVARGLNVVAVDPSGGMLEQLRAAVPGVPAMIGRAEEIPLQDGVVDAVLVAQAWHWVDPERAPREVARVLRPGGRLGLV